MLYKDYLVKVIKVIDLINKFRMVDEPVESTGFELEYKQTIIFSVFSQNIGKYRLEETPYLDIFHAVKRKIALNVRSRIS